MNIVCSNIIEINALPCTFVISWDDDEFAWTHAPASDDVVQVHMIVSTIQMMFIIYDNTNITNHTFHLYDLIQTCWITLYRKFYMYNVSSHSFSLHSMLFPQMGHVIPMSYDSPIYIGPYQHMHMQLIMRLSWWELEVRHCLLSWLLGCLVACLVGNTTKTFHQKNNNNQKIKKTAKKEIQCRISRTNDWNKQFRHFR